MRTRTGIPGFILILVLSSCTVSPELTNPFSKNVTVSEKKVPEEKPVVNDSSSKPVLESPVKNIITSQTSFILNVGSEIDIPATVKLENGEVASGLKWAADDNTIVNVTESGKITALKTGETRIKISSPKNPDIFAECTVTVKDTQNNTQNNTIVNIIVIKPEIPDPVPVNTSFTFEAYVKYINDNFDRDLTWKTSDETILTVNGQGLVKTLRAGQATITVSSNKNPDIKQSYTLKVIVPVEPVKTPGTGSSGSSSNSQQTSPQLPQINFNLLKDEILVYNNTSVPDTLYIMKGNGKNPYKIKPGLGSMENPTISFTQNNILFQANGSLYAVNIDGSALRHIRSNKKLGRYSPDTLRIVYHTDSNEITTSDLTGTDSKTIISGRSCFNPDYSPTGQKIVYVCSDQSLHIINADTTGDETVVSGISVLSPLWSPDGKKIAYLVEGAKTNEIYTINTDTGVITNITKGKTLNLKIPQLMKWSKDSSVIFFAGNSGTYDVYAIKADGSVYSRVPANLAAAPDCCNFNTGKIVYSSDKDGTNKLYIMNADKTGITLLADIQSVNARLMYDRNRVTFEGNDGLYTVNSDGTNLVKIAGTDASFDFPNWLYNIEILFSGNGPFVGLFFMDGSGLTGIPMTNPSNNNIVPSRDFSKVAYTSSKTGESAVNIYTMNIDLSNQTQITDTELNINPNWSPPDSSKIVFESKRGADLDNNIYIMDADGSNQTGLTTFGANTPVWSPDGKKIAFNSVKDGKKAIYLMNPDGTGVEPFLQDRAVNYTLQSWH